MATINAADAVNSVLVAKKNVTKYDSQGNIIGVFRPGEIVGTVWSYTTKPIFRWMFYPDGDTSQPPYFTRHAEGLYQKNTKIVEAEIKAEQALENIKKTEMGAVAYYFERYAIPVGLGIAVLVISTTVIKKKL